MATVILPDLDERTLDRARAAVAARGGSLEHELSQAVEARAREIKPKAGRRRRAVAVLAALKANADELEKEYGPFPSTTELIREERDSW